MIRKPTTFSYPVVYPNGVVIYCETYEEQQELQKQIELFKEELV